MYALTRISFFLIGLSPILIFSFQFAAICTILMLLPLAFPKQKNRQKKEKIDIL